MRVFPVKITLERQKRPVTGWLFTQKGRLILEIPAGAGMITGPTGRAPEEVAPLRVAVEPVGVIPRRKAGFHYCPRRWKIRSLAARGESGKQNSSGRPALADQIVPLEIIFPVFSGWGRGPGPAGAWQAWQIWRGNAGYQSSRTRQWLLALVLLELVPLLLFFGPAGLHRIWVFVFFSLALMYLLARPQVQGLVRDLRRLYRRQYPLEPADNPLPGEERKNHYPDVGEKPGVKSGPAKKIRWKRGRWPALALTLALLGDLWWEPLFLFLALPLVLLWSLSFLSRPRRIGWSAGALFLVACLSLLPFQLTRYQLYGQGLVIYLANQGWDFWKHYSTVDDGNLKKGEYENPPLGVRLKWPEPWRAEIPAVSDWLRDLRPGLPLVYLRVAPEHSSPLAGSRLTVYYLREGFSDGDARPLGQWYRRELRARAPFWEDPRPESVLYPFDSFGISGAIVQPGALEFTKRIAGREQRIRFQWYYLELARGALVVEGLEPIRLNPDKKDFLPSEIFKLVRRGLKIDRDPPGAREDDSEDEKKPPGPEKGA